jgi:hypothetical protein
VDWAARIAAEFFTVMTHSNMLLWIGAFSRDGEEITSSKIDPDKPEIIPENIQHKDNTSEKLFPFLYARMIVSGKRGWHGCFRRISGCGT